MAATAFQYYIIFQSTTALEDGKLVTISRMSEAGQTSRSYDFSDTGMVLVCTIYILLNKSSLYYCSEKAGASDYAGLVSHTLCLAKTGRSSIVTITFGAWKVPVPHFTRRCHQIVYGIST
jgi:hypothetical protein